MYIGFITMGREIGGAAQDVITLSKGLSKIGHEVFVISSAGVMDKELIDTKVKFVNAPLYTRNLVGLWKASRKIRMIARQNKIEILNPQGIYPAISCWLASFGFSHFKFKVAITIHMISNLKFYKFAWILNCLSKNIITESYCERNRLTSYGVKVGKVSVISNSVDMEKFSKEKSKPILREEYKIGDDTCCFGIVARLSKEKRHLDFVAAAKIVFNNNPNVKFFIVGDGPEKENIMEAIKGSEDNIILTGMRRDIPDVLKSLDCFVLCSEVESLPLSIREAMSMALPVITTDVGGVREAVLEGITGYVVPPNDLTRLAESMVKIANNECHRKSLGSRGRELCQACFELNNWTSKTTELFLKILNN